MNVGQCCLRESVIAVIVVVAMVTPSCASRDGAGAVGPMGTYRRIPVEADNFYGIAWIGISEVAVARSPRSRQKGNSTIVAVNVNDSEVRSLLSEQDPRCRVTDYLRPTRLPDGRLGLLKWCARNNSRTEVTLVAYAPEAGNTRKLMESPITPARVSWAPNLRRAIISNSDELCSGIALLEDGEIRTYDSRIVDGNKSFLLSEAFFSVGVDGCRETGLADWPSWSPDGVSIAFFASPASVGVDGFEKPETPWNLYTMNPDGSGLRVVLEGIRDPRALSWSPNGKQLAFSGAINDQDGTWLTTESGSNVRRLTAIAVEWLDWHPDGQSLATVSRSEEMNELGVLSLN